MVYRWDQGITACVIFIFKTKKKNILILKVEWSFLSCLVLLRLLRLTWRSSSRQRLRLHFQPWMLPTRPEALEPNGRVSWTRWRFTVFCHSTISWAVQLLTLYLCLTLKVKAVVKAAGCPGQMNLGFWITIKTIHLMVLNRHNLMVPIG